MDKHTEVIKADKTRIVLYENFLEYYTNYVIEQEFVYTKDTNTDDEELSRLLEDANTEPKRIKIEDQGVLAKDNIYISRLMENLLNEPGEGTTLFYKIIIEYLNTSIEFTFKTRKEQTEIYNKLINWQIKQNKWK